jgi:GNAT superfamily N-acetyltransferase
LLLDIVISLHVVICYAIYNGMSEIEFLGGKIEPVGTNTLLFRHSLGGSDDFCQLEVNAMNSVSDFEIKDYCNHDKLPAEAEEMFARQLAESRQPLPADRPDREQWRFALACAVTSSGHVLGGVYLDIGPINGAGPMAERKLAYLERTLVRPEHQRQGIATALLKRAIRAAADSSCEYIRCSNDWDNPAESALFRKCGFALVDLNSDKEQEPCYLAVRPVQNTGV